MPSLVKGPSYITPFGNRSFLGSTRDVKTEGRTCAKSTVPTVTVDGFDTKMLPKGVVMAKITSGADAGKIGPHYTGASDGRQTVANFVGVNNTFLPTQLQHRDVEVAVVYEATVVAAKLLEWNGSAWVAATGTTTAALEAAAGNNNVSLLYRVPSSEL